MREALRDDREVLRRADDAAARRSASARSTRRCARGCRRRAGSARDQLVHAPQVIEVGVEVIEEDRVQEHAADLRQRRAASTGAALAERRRGAELLARERVRGALRADADGEHVRGAETDRRAERRRPGAARRRRSRGRPPSSARAPAGRRSGSPPTRSTWSTVELDRQHDAPALHPHRMARAPLDEGERAPRVVARRRHGDRVEMPAADHAPRCRAAGSSARGAGRAAWRRGAPVSPCGRPARRAARSRTKP